MKLFSKEDIITMPQLRQALKGFLLKSKGYLEEDLEENTRFEIQTETRLVTINVDFLIRFNNKRVMLLQCYPTALVTREKYSLAIARLIEDYQIPYLVITDGFEIEVFDVVAGKVIGQSLEDIPAKQELQQRFNQIPFVTLTEFQRIKEKRILAAFDLLRCPTCQLKAKKSLSNGEKV